MGILAWIILIKSPVIQHRKWFRINFCRGNCRAKTIKNGEREGRIPNHITTRDKHSTEMPTREHCYCEGEVADIYHVKGWQTTKLTPVRLTDRPTHWPTCWPTYWMTHQPTQWRTDWLTNCLTDQLTHWPTDSLTNWPTDQLNNWPTDQLTCWPTDSLTNWLTDQLTCW